MTDPIIVLTPDQLRDLVRDSVRAEISDLKRESFVDAESAANHLGVTTRTLSKMIKEERLPVHHAGKNRRFLLSELDAWMKEE